MFEPLNKLLHRRADFDCGGEFVNQFLKERALKHTKLGFSKTWVLAEAVQSNPSEPKPIKAYFTLSHLSISRESLPAAGKLPAYPVPVLLLAQLGVDRQFQGLGLGSGTLMAALKQAALIHANLPSHALLVDAVSEQLVGFYEAYGFERLAASQQDLRLFLPMQTLLKVVD